MLIHVTQTYTITTEHEVDLNGKTEEFSIQVALGLPGEHQTHAVLDALRSLPGFNVVLAHGSVCGKSKIEIK